MQCYAKIYVLKRALGAVDNSSGELRD